MITNLKRMTLNPRTDRWQRAEWMPHWFGKNKWAVRFPSQEGVVDPLKVRLETRNG